MREHCSYTSINPASKPFCWMCVKMCVASFFLFFFLCLLSLYQRHAQMKNSLITILRQALLKSQTACAKKTTSLPFSFVLNSGWLIWYTKAHTWLSPRICAQKQNIATVAEMKWKCRAFVEVRFLFLAVFATCACVHWMKTLPLSSGSLLNDVLD